MKIRTRLMTLMFSLVATSLILSSGLSYWLNTSYIKHDNRMVQKVRTQEAIELIDSFLERHKQRVQDQSDHLYSLIYLFEGDIDPSLQAFLESDSLYREVSLVEDNGREISRVSRDIFFSPGEMRSFSEDALFLRTIEEKTCFHKDIRRNAFGEPVIDLYCPLIDVKSEVSHVLIHRMNLKPLWEVLSAIHLGETGFAFVADRQGYIIAHPDFSSVLSKLNVSGLSIFKRLIDMKPEIGQEGLVLSAKEDEIYYSGGVSDESGWIVVLRHDAVEVDKQIVFITRSLMAGMGVFLILGFFFSFVLSKQIAMPLGALTYGVECVERGDLTFTVQVQSNDEIGDLSTGFNRMAESLKKTTVSRDYVDNIIASMLNMLIVLSPEGKIKTVNNATCSVLGFKEEELIGQSAGKVLKGVDFSDMENEKIFDVEPLQRRERVYLTKRGEEIPVLFTGSIMHDVEGEIQGIVCMAQDISDRKQAEFELKAFADRLAESNKELVDFAYVASHDLQEPLRKVTAFGDRLKTKWGDVLGEQGCDYLDRMRNAACRMQDLIDSLLSFSRVTTKANPFEAVDLDKILREVLSDLEIRIEQTKARVEVGEMATIDADPIQMRQLLQNLIANALKFNQKDLAPFVTISSQLFTERRRGEAAPLGRELCQITVEDKGIGFDEKYADRIFGVFQRLHGRNEYEGTGIGLSICKKIVERHSGTITAMSVLGKGSKFIVSLPIKQVKEESLEGGTTNG